VPRRQHRNITQAPDTNTGTNTGTDTDSDTDIRGTEVFDTYPRSSSTTILRPEHDLSRLPVIVGFGGVNPAGRSSAHHAYRRLVIDALPDAKAEPTYRALAALMGKDPAAPDRSWILEHTLVRRLETNLFDPSAIRSHRALKLSAADAQPIAFTLRRKQLPPTIPAGWQVEPADGDHVRVTVVDAMDVMIAEQNASTVNSAGQLPTGFEPETLYQSRQHPRGLQLTVYGASDALLSLGMDWEDVRNHIAGDQMSVYASSAMGQLDTNGHGGMLQASLLGKRVSARNLPLGLAEMTADFINAYVLGSVGNTGANIGACATFLYNLRQGIDDIRSGKCRVVIVGSSEAPLTPEVMDGYRTMGALAEDAALADLDGANAADHQRACRPFSDNCGFTLAEGAQFVVLFDDELALETGANIYGAVADVFINADGFKKSIPGPGIGNYVTMGKAAGLVRSMLGEDSLKHRTYVQAHGTGTPQNRVTESHIINELARHFGISAWPVTAIKSYLGHTLATAAGDQLVTSLGVWADGIIPSINTIDHVASDVHHSHIDLLMKHKEVDPRSVDAVFVNAKGFGGNNATAAILSPTVTRDMLARKHGAAAMSVHATRNETVAAATEKYDEQTIAGETELIYRFGENVVDGSELTIDAHHIAIPGHRKDISLDIADPYEDFS
jgi:acetoacetyl-[acyl-carrier protein] synthase